MSEPAGAAAPDARKRQAVLGLCLLLFFEGILLYHYGWRGANLRHVDLPSFYFAAERAFVEGASPYDHPVIARRAPEIGQGVYPYLHPPPALIPLAPLALVSYPTAKSAVLALNHLLVPLLAYLLAFRLARFEERLLAFLVCAFLLLSFPVTQTIVHGQVNLAAAVLIVLCWLGLRREGAWWPGVALALAILLKQTPLILIAVLIAERRWRALLAAIVVLALAVVGSLATVPEEAWSDWLEVVRPSLAYGATPAHLFSPACPFNQSLNGFVARFYLAPKCAPPPFDVPAAGRTLTWVLALGVVALSLAALRRLRRRPAETRIDLGFALLLPATFLISPLSWEHHLVLVLPSLVVALDAVGRRGRHFLPLAGLLGLCILGIALPLPVGSPLLRQGPWIPVISIRTYAVALLWALLLAFAFARPRAADDREARDMLAV